MKEYEEAFRPMYITTKLLQAEHQAFSDFYMNWILAIRNLQSLKNNRFAAPLIQSLRSRLKMLTQNMAFKAALFLDPRFNYLNSTVLSPAEKEEVQKYLIKTWRRIQQTKRVNPMPNGAGESISTNNEESLGDEIADFLTEMFGGTLQTQGATADPEAQLTEQLKLLEIGERMPHDHNVWDHWIARKATHPQLSAVVLVVLATASSQVSVERAFSGLALILSDLRTGLSEDTLEHILLIKLNESLLDRILPSLTQHELQPNT
nr:uncharacterized protein LOC109402841 [Aedes albopictus]